VFVPDEIALKAGEPPVESAAHSHAVSPAFLFKISVAAQSINPRLAASVPVRRSPWLAVADET
jgi:hypothetical protein